jgi:hypothetical protein
MMKFTKRRNGLQMASVQVRYHVPKEMFDFIHLNTEKNLSQTEQWIWDNLHELCDDWKTLVVDSDGDPYTTSSEDNDYYEEKGLVYDGPDILRSRR